MAKLYVTCHVAKLYVTCHVSQRLLRNFVPFVAFCSEPWRVVSQILCHLFASFPYLLGDMVNLNIMEPMESSDANLVAEGLMGKLIRMKNADASKLFL